MLKIYRYVFIYANNKVLNNFLMIFLKLQSIIEM